jgi:hypothetical protein
MVRTFVLSALALGLAALLPLAAWAQSAPSDPALSWIAAEVVAHPWALWAMLAWWAASPLAAYLPPAVPGSPWATVRGVLDWAAFNTGSAANRILAAPGVQAAIGPAGSALFTAEHMAQTVAAALAVGQTTAAPPPAPPAAASPTGPVAAMLGTLALVGLLGLGACSAQQEQAACAADKALQPGAVAAVGTLGGPEGAAVAAIDGSVVHPLVLGGCAALVPAAPAAAAPKP